MALPCLTMLLQYPDDLFFSEATAFHVLVLILSQNELQSGLNPWGNVSNYRHAREIIEEWRIDYNLKRPHTSLNGLTPNEFATRSKMDHNANRANL